MRPRTRAPAPDWRIQALVSHWGLSASEGRAARADAAWWPSTQLTTQRDHVWDRRPTPHREIDIGSTRLAFSGRLCGVRVPRRTRASCENDAAIAATRFLDKVIRPSLMCIGMHSRQAEILVLGTALHESKLRERDQRGGGQALGLFQIEPETHSDIWDNYLRFRPTLARRVEHLLDLEPDRTQQLRDNDRYGAALARIHYERTGLALPDAADLDGQARFWKSHYNTHLGRGRPEDYVRSWTDAFNETGTSNRNWRT